MRDIHLTPGIPGGRWARLRPMCGHDEAAIDPAGSMDVVPFLDRLLAPAAGTSVGPGSAASLTVSDCDRLCAAIYIEYFSDQIEGRVTCDGCHESFEMNFSLSTLMTDLNNRGPAQHNEHGVFTAPDGRRFRLPTAGEQREVIGLGTDAAVTALLERCVVTGDPHQPDNSIEEAMEAAGAILDVDLDAFCPHCDRAQTVHFDMQSYLFRALGYERQFLVYEVHRIATAYGWPHREILDLSREDRRKFVQLIESERTTRRRAQSWTAI